MKLESSDARDMVLPDYGFEAFQGDPIGRSVFPAADTAWHRASYPIASRLQRIFDDIVGRKHGDLRYSSLSPWTGAFVMLSIYVISGVASVGFLWLTGSADVRTLRGYVSEDQWFGLVFGLVMFPLVGWFYSKCSLESGQIIGKLHESGALKLTPNDVAMAQRIHAWRGWTQISVAIVVVAAAVWFTSGVLTNTPTYASRVGNWFTAPSALLAWFLVCMIISRLVSTMIVLRYVFGEKSVTLLPLHPDRVGGLKAVSEYAMSFGVFLAIGGSGLAVIGLQSVLQHTLDQNYVYLAATGIYILLSPLIFFGTLGAAHEPMLKSKEDLLLRISESFDDQFHSALSRLERDATPIPDELRRIEDLNRLYKLADGFPVWPFDTSTLRRFFTLVAAPLVPVAVAQAVDVIADLW